VKMKYVRLYRADFLCLLAGTRAVDTSGAELLTVRFIAQASPVAIIYIYIYIEGRTVVRP